MSNKTVFEKIIDGEIPSVKVFEDDICIVIMDKFPTIEGQVLVIPKKAVNYTFDLDDKTYNHLFKISKNIARALDKALETERTCLVVEGFEVPHAHIKLYPVKDKHLVISEGQEVSDNLLNELADKIKTNL